MKIVGIHLHRFRGAEPWEHYMVVESGRSRYDVLISASTFEELMHILVFEKEMQISQLSAEMETITQKTEALSREETNGCQWLWKASTEKVKYSPSE
jgi:hypothetical protein